MKRKAALILETTEVPAVRSAGEITELLVQFGATHISMEYSPDGTGRIVGMYFVLPIADTPLHYRMPVKTQGIYNHLLNRTRGHMPASKIQDKAERIAWRQLLLWIKAQLAMSECGMADAMQVFLPYCEGKDGKTVYELFLDQRLALPKPEEATNAKT